MALCELSVFRPTGVGHFAMHSNLMPIPYYAVSGYDFAVSADFTVHGITKKLGQITWAHNRPSFPYRAETTVRQIVVETKYVTVGVVFVYVDMYT